MRDSVSFIAALTLLAISLVGSPAGPREAVDNGLLSARGTSTFQLIDREGRGSQNIDHRWHPMQRIVFHIQASQWWSVFCGTPTLVGEWTRESKLDVMQHAGGAGYKGAYLIHPPIW